jgi:hypothetical protein
MNHHPGYRSFLLKAGLILVMGVVILFSLTVGILKATNAPGTMTVTEVNSANNTVGSYGITGYEPIAVDPEAGNVPAFIKNPLKEKRGVILLVYLAGATEDEQMRGYFDAIKAKYAAQGSFFSFEARKVSELGNVMSQLKISQPPALAVISPDGSVYEEYTGWIGKQVMEQVVANALRH